MQSTQRFRGLGGGACVLVAFIAACFEDSSGVPDATTTTGSTSGSGTVSGSADDSASGDANTGSGTTTTAGPSTSGADGSATSGDASTSGTDSDGSMSCGSGLLCLPDVPNEWEGPVALGSADAECPAGFPTPTALVHRDFVAGLHQCGCSCNVGSVQCRLVMENSGEEFVPNGSCDSPTYEDECIGAAVQTSCIVNGVNVPAEPDWQDSVVPCSGARRQQACDSGHCYPDSDASLCVLRDGDHSCPSGFDQRSIYYRSFEDTRTCSSCSCIPSGQSCELEVEICSVGFYDVTLTAGEACHQLASSDGDGVTLMSSSVTGTGSCSAAPNAGQLSGAAVPAEPVTVCCLE